MGVISPSPVVVNNKWDCVWSIKLNRNPQSEVHWRRLFHTNNSIVIQHSYGTAAPLRLDSSSLSRETPLVFQLQEKEVVLFVCLFVCFTKTCIFFFFFFLVFLFFKYIYWLCYYSCPIAPFPLTPLHPAHPLPSTFPPYSSCPWVILIIFYILM